MRTQLRKRRYLAVTLLCALHPLSPTTLRPSASVVSDLGQDERRGPKAQASDSPLPELVIQRRRSGYVAAFCNHKRIVALGEEDTIGLWSLDTGLLLRDLKGVKREVAAITCSPDGRVLAASSGTTIQLWDIE